MDELGSAPLEMGNGEVSTLLSGGWWLHQESSVYHEMCPAVGKKGQLSSWDDQRQWLWDLLLTDTSWSHGAMWLPPQTWHCCLLVLPSDAAMSCRADHELKVETDGCCCLL